MVSKASMLSMLNMLGVDQIEIYFIYLLTNIENGKKYVGQTVDIKARWRQHKSDARCDPKWPINFAIAKYGIEKFTLDIIDFAVGKWQAGCLEDNCITIHNSLTTGWGYNIRRGGPTAPNSKETRAKISAAKKGKPNLKKRKFNEAQELQMIILYQSGLSGKDIGTQFNTLPDGILDILRRHNIKRRSSSESHKGKPSSHKLNFSNVAQIQMCNLYKSGMSAYDIGKQFNISEKPIYRILLEHNIQIRSRSENMKGKYKLSLEQIKEIQSDTRSAAILAKEYKISERLIYTYKNLKIS
jgi:group I intron endonuclease